MSEQNNTTSTRDFESTYNEGKAETRAKILFDKNYDSHDKFGITETGKRELEHTEELQQKTQQSLGEASIVGAGLTPAQEEQLIVFGSRSNVSQERLDQVKAQMIAKNSRN